MRGDFSNIEKHYNTKNNENFWVVANEDKIVGCVGLTKLDPKYFFRRDKSKKQWKAVEGMNIAELKRMSVDPAI